MHTAASCFAVADRRDDRQTAIHSPDLPGGSASLMAQALNLDGHFIDEQVRSPDIRNHRP
jgi:hypothetical protein